VEKKRFCFDIDNTICDTVGTLYHDSTPNYQIIEIINTLYDNGHYIILHTARGTLSKIEYEALTRDQLAKWRVKYNELIMGKPAADIYIDDKAINVANIDFLGVLCGII